MFENLFLKFNFSIKLQFQKINDYDFSIQDFVQGCPLQNLIF